MLRSMDRRRIGIGLALVAALISGVSVWVNAMAVKAFGDAILYTTVKNVIAAALLIAIAAVLTTRMSRQGLTPPRGVRQVLGLSFVGVVGGGVAFVLFFQGLALTTASSAGFIQKTLVIWVAILAVSFLRERFGGMHVAAIALLVVGQLLAAGGAAMPVLRHVALGHRGGHREVAARRTLAHDGRGRAHGRRQCCAHRVLSDDGSRN
jgi:drug/metabolite transporter (DMT)-like permease